MAEPVGWHISKHSPIFRQKSLFKKAKIRTFGIYIDCRNIWLYIKIIMQRFMLFFLFAGWILLPAPIRADEDSRTPPLFNEEQFRIKFHTGYHYTESNFINRSRSEPLHQALKLKAGPPPFFHFMETGLNLGYNAFSWLSAEVFLAGFWFAQSGNGTKLYVSSPEVKRVGGILRSPHLIKGVFGFIPEISFSHPFFSINYNTQTPITDDGVWHLTPALWLYGVLLDIVHPFVYTGLKWRSQPLSSLFQWKAGLMLRADIAEMGFYVHGFWPVTVDQSSSLIGDRVSLLKRVNAGSLRFFSSNPQVIGGTGWLAWHFPHLTLRLSGDMDWIGSHYSKGYGVLAEIIIKIGKVQKTKVEAIFDNSKAQFTPDMVEDFTPVQKSFENIKEPPRIEEEDIGEILTESETIEEQRILSE